METLEKLGLAVEDRLSDNAGIPLSQSNEIQSKQERKPRRRRHHRRHRHRHRRRESPARKRQKRSDSFEASRKKRYEERCERLELEKSLNLELLSLICRSGNRSVGTQVANSRESSSQTTDAESLISEQPEVDGAGKVKPISLDSIDINYAFDLSLSSMESKKNSKDQTISDLSDVEIKSISSGTCDSSVSSSYDDESSEASDITDTQGWLLTYDLPSDVIIHQPKPLGPMYSMTTLENEDGFFESRKKEAINTVTQKYTNQPNHCCGLIRCSSWVKSSRSTQQDDIESHMLCTNVNEELQLRVHFAQLGHLISFKANNAFEFIKPNPIIVRSRKRSFTRFFYYHWQKTIGVAVSYIGSMIRRKRRNNIAYI